ncbi:hypothetical protein [Streptomyces sp. NPDC050738]|uniref:hypothetical protein n=1 Tax=Streptomyces sp. NPDC050738 TaxID=3154744 RepID=UPI0034289AE8
MAEPITLRDLADAWHVVTLLGLTSPTAATVTDATAVLLIALALQRHQIRPALTLAATTTVSLAAATLL